MAKAKCTPCMSDAAKRLLVDAFPDLALQLNGVAPCKKGEVALFCGNTRKKSEYQQFASQCLLDKHLKGFDPEAMKDCARQWRERRPVAARR